MLCIGVAAAPPALYLLCSRSFNQSAQFKQISFAAVEVSSTEHGAQSISITQRTLHASAMHNGSGDKMQRSARPPCRQTLSSCVVSPRMAISTDGNLKILQAQQSHVRPHLDFLLVKDSVLPYPIVSAVADARSCRWPLHESCHARRLQILLKGYSTLSEAATEDQWRVLVINLLKSGFPR